MLEDVGEAEQDRELDAAVLELIDEFLEVDRSLGVLVRMDGDVAELVDAEVAFAPVADAVGSRASWSFHFSVGSCSTLAIKAAPFS